MENKTPLWRKVAKGLVGILFLSALTSFLLTLLTYRLTERELAISTLTNGLALGFSPKGLDDPTQFANINQSIGEITKTLKETGLSINFNVNDLAGLSPREQRMKIFGQVAETIYSGDTKSLVTVPKNEITSQIPIIGSDNPVTLISSSSHDKIRQKLPLIIATTTLLAVLYIFLCRGFSRFSSPGWLIIIACIPGLLIMTLLPPFLASHSFGSAEVNERVHGITSQLLPPILTVIKQIYMVSAAVGIGLVVIGTIGAIVWRFKSKDSQNKSKVATATPPQKASEKT